jgi:hypothetical protein
VLDDFGDFGCTYRETDEPDANAASVIDNLCAASNKDGLVSGHI